MTTCIMTSITKILGSTAIRSKGFNAMFEVDFKSAVSSLVRQVCSGLSSILIDKRTYHNDKKCLHKFPM